MSLDVGQILKNRIFDGLVSGEHARSNALNASTSHYRFYLASYGCYRHDIL